MWPPVYQRPPSLPRWERRRCAVDPQLMIGAAVAILVLVAAIAVRPVRRRRRRRARKWYHDHARLTPITYAAVRFDRSPDAGPAAPTIRLALRDVGLRTCRLEENTER
jgi:hypothetical protein